jgi:hypothetical protein
MAGAALIGLILFSTVTEIQNYQWSQASREALQDLGDSSSGSTVDVLGTVEGANGTVVATCVVAKGGTTCSASYVTLVQDDATAVVILTDGLQFVNYPHTPASTSPEFIAGTQVQVLGVWNGNGGVTAKVVAGPGWIPAATPEWTVLNAGGWTLASLSLVQAARTVRRTRELF